MYHVLVHAVFQNVCDTLEMIFVEILTAYFATFVREVTAVVVIVAEVTFTNASRRVWTFALTRWTFYVC